MSLSHWPLCIVFAASLEHNYGLDHPSVALHLQFREITDNLQSSSVSVSGIHGRIRQGQSDFESSGVKTASGRMSRLN